MKKEQEKKPEPLSCEEQLAMAIQFMKGRPADTDDPFSGEIDAEVVRKLHELYKRWQS